MTDRSWDSEDAAAHAASLAKAASRVLAVTTAAQRNGALERVALELEAARPAILAANARDALAARKRVRSDARPVPLDRLVLDEARLRVMREQVREVAALEDPIGRVLERTLLDEDLELQRVSCPLGVVAAVIEARPDAVTQLAALALKSGNALLLKCGREALDTAREVTSAIRRALLTSDCVPVDAVILVEGRPAFDRLLALDTIVDLVVARGSAELVRGVVSRTRIPVLGHAAGVCHVYVDAAARTDMAIDIVLDAKVQYAAACNSVETVLVHEAAALRVVPPLVARLRAAGVEVRGCERTRLHAPAGSVVPANATDFGTEFGCLVLAMRLVDDVEEAVRNIDRFGSRHTDAIVTDDARAAAYFLAHVDSAGVFHNASTRFADGYRYGLGAEVGISTGKIHARGPVGLSGLTTSKHLLRGRGHLVASYVGPRPRRFLHERRSDHGETQSS
jgi:gamma-glutamyl phosphate reductase